MLIPSKLSRPVRLHHTVVRDRLLAKLSGAGNYRLALVTCPAGYGKTTLISQWAAGKADLGWYSLDEGDNQQERFASYLIAAMQQATGGRCVASEAMSQKRQYASLSSLFVSAVYRTGRLAPPAVPGDRRLPSDHQPGHP